MVAKRIIILDDHPVIMDGMKRLLQDDERFVVEKTLTSFSSLMDALREAFDILILDLNIRGVNSLSKLEEIKAKQPSLKVLIFSSYHSPAMVKKALQKEVDGYALKDIGQEDFILALDTIAQGKQYVDPKLAFEKKMTTIGKASDFEDEFIKKASLTARELEVMQAIVEGLDSQAIADRLFISLHTVQTHRKRLFKKLDIHSASELIKLVLDR